jgi:hypothetical protein
LVDQVLECGRVRHGGNGTWTGTAWCVNFLGLSP